MVVGYVVSKLRGLAVITQIVNPNTATAQPRYCETT